MNGKTAKLVRRVFRALPAGAGREYRRLWGRMPGTRRASERRQMVRALRDGIALGAGVRGGDEFGIDRSWVSL